MPRAGHGLISQLRARNTRKVLMAQALVGLEEAHRACEVGAVATFPAVLLYRRTDIRVTFGNAVRSAARA